VDAAGVVRQAGGTPGDARSAAAAFNREIFAGTLSPVTLEAASRATAQGVSPAVKSLALCLAGPEMQAR
jgi:hypothetical protein